MDGCPLGLGLVVEDKPTEFSCIIKYKSMLTCVCVHVCCGGMHNIKSR